MFQSARKSIAATQFINPRLLIPISFFAFAVAATMGSGQTSEDQVVDLSHVPQIHETPAQQIGAMNLNRDWESCMILSPTPQHDGWSYRSNGKTRPLARWTTAHPGRSRCRVRWPS